MKFFQRYLTSDACMVLKLASLTPLYKHITFISELHYVLSGLNVLNTIFSKLLG